jgi:hypothetical protein
MAILHVPVRDAGTGSRRIAREDILQTTKSASVGPLGDNPAFFLDDLPSSIDSGAEGGRGRAASASPTAGSHPRDDAERV